MQTPLASAPAPRRRENTVPRGRAPLLGSGERGREGQPWSKSYWVQNPLEALYTSSNSRFCSHLGAFNHLSARTLGLSFAAPDMEATQPA